MFRRKHFSGLPAVIFILSVPLGGTGKFHHRSEFYTKYNATKALLTLIFIFFHTLSLFLSFPDCLPPSPLFLFPPDTHTHTHTTEGLHFHFSLSLSCIGEGNGNPLQCSCLESPRDEGAWWASIYGVAQSRKWLKQLSSRSSIYIYKILSQCLHLTLTNILLSHLLQVRLCIFNFYSIKSFPVLYHFSH